MTERISIQDLIQVTVSDGRACAVQVQDGPMYVTTCGPGGPGSSLNDKVAADIDDPTAGYLSEKVDGTTIDVDLINHELKITDAVLNQIAENVMNEFVSPEYTSFTLLGADYYVDVVHGLDTDRIIQGVEIYRETSPSVWEWKDASVAWVWISDNTRRLLFYPEPVKSRCYMIGSKT